MIVPPTPPQPVTAPSGRFLNLSHHPGAAWSVEQQAAALALGWQIVDLSFPDVDPNVDEAEVAVLTQTLLAQVPADITHAMVQGEFTLSFALVARLQQRGIRCWAATTRRVAETQPDGSRTSRFVFVRFRAYPNLADSGGSTRSGDNV